MFLLSFISSVIGGFITGAIFYWRGAKDLRQEAEQLRKLSVLMLRALETAGFVELNRDQAGNPTGLVIKVGIGLGEKMDFMTDSFKSVLRSEVKKTAV
jgi:hypothetical protein